MLRKIWHGVALLVAVLFIAVSLGGGYAVWRAARWAGEAAGKVSGGLRTATGAVQRGAERVATLVDTCQSEVQRATETVAAVEGRSATIGPVLTELSERLETRLEPRMAEAQEALTVARDALLTVEATMELLRSLQIVEDGTPEAERFDAMLKRLQELPPQVMQMRETLRVLAATQAGELRAEILSKLSGQMERLNAGLMKVRDEARDLQVRLSRFQDRVDLHFAHTLFFIRFAALLLMLLLAWNVYAQVVVIRHHRRRLDGPQEIESLRTAP